MTNKNMDGWKIEEEAAEKKLGRKLYKNMVRVSRPCQTCTARFEIWVQQSVVEGKTANNSLRLRNCELHRGAKNPGVDAQQEIARLSAEVEQLKVDNQMLARQCTDLNAALATTYNRIDELEGGKMPWET